jgi:hypothetical protein
MVTAGSLALTSDMPDSSVLGGRYDGSVTVAGGTGPYTWSLSGSLPGGLRATPDGAQLILGGNPVATGTFPFRVSVHDSSAPQRTASQSLSVTVAAGNPLTLVDSVPGTATVGARYSGSVVPSGGNGHYVWGSVSGLPPGLTANESDSGVVILGQPTRAGSYTLRVTVSDTSDSPQTVTESYPVSVGSPDWSVSGSPPASGQVGTPYPDTAFHASSGVPVTWSASGLPPGLSIDPGSGLVSGTPTAEGSYDLVVTATETSTGTTRTSGPATITITPAAASPSASSSSTSS